MRESLIIAGLVTLTALLGFWLGPEGAMASVAVVLLAAIGGLALRGLSRPVPVSRGRLELAAHVRSRGASALGAPRTRLDAGASRTRLDAGASTASPGEGASTASPGEGASTARLDAGAARARLDAGASRTPRAEPKELAASAEGLGRWIALTLVVRVVVVFILNLTPIGMALATDSYIYDKVGQIIADSWSQPGTDLSLVNGYHATSLYLHQAALAHYLFGADIDILMSLLNAALGTLAAYNLAQVAGDLYGHRARRTAFLLAAFFPSILMWTCLSLREGWSFLTVSVFLLAGHRLRQRFSVRDLALVAGASFLMVFIRPYVAPMLVVSLALSYTIVRVRQLPVAIVVVALAAVFLSSADDLLGFRRGFVNEASLETLQTIRTGLAYGNSAYGATADTTTVGGALSFLPVGVAYFLGAPFPWSLSSWRQLVAFPETMVWYGLLFAGVKQLIHDARTRLTRTGLLLVTPLVMVPIYGLIEGNEGTAYRHRAQVMLLFFVLAAGYLARRAEARTGAQATGRDELRP